MKRFALIAVLLLCLILRIVHAQQVSYERLLRASDEPQNWLTYSGTYFSQRYSLLRQITSANVKTLEQKGFSRRSRWKSSRRHRWLSTESCISRRPQATPSQSMLRRVACFGFIDTILRRM